MLAVRELDLKIDAARFIDSDLILSVREVQALLYEEDDDFSDDGLSEQSNADADEQDVSVEEKWPHLTPEAALCADMIANAVKDVQDFAAICESLVLPPVRHHGNGPNIQSQNFIYDNYEEMKVSAAQSIFWIMSDKKTDEMSFTFKECAEVTNCGITGDGLTGFRKRLLGRVPITRKLISALLEYAEELGSIDATDFTGELLGQDL